MRIPIETREGIAWMQVDESWSYRGRLGLGNHGYAWLYDEDGRQTLVHRWLLGLRPGDRLVGDHINRNKLDNRLRNLRAIDPSTSNANRCFSCDPYVNTYRARSGRWQGKFGWRGYRHYVGTFDSREEAAVAILRYREEHCPDSIVDPAAEAA